MVQYLESQVKATLGLGSFVELFPDARRTNVSDLQLMAVDDIAAIQTARLPDTEEAQTLRQQAFYVGNTGNYGVERNGDVTVCVADFANHPGKGDFGEFARELIENQGATQ